MPANANRLSERFLFVLSFFCIYVIWGGTFLARRFALESIPPFVLSGSRFITAGLIMQVFARLVKAPALSTADRRSSILIGVLLLFGGTGMVAWAQLYVPSGIASLFVGSVPMWMVLVDWVWNRGPRPSNTVLAGLVTGFAGIWLLIGRTGPAGSGPVHPVGAVILVLASLSWAVGSVYSKRLPAPASHLRMVAVQMLSGGTALILFAVLLGQTGSFDPGRISLSSLAAFAYLVLGGSVAGFTAYHWLLKRTTPATVATHAFINPMVAVLIGWAAGGEALTGRILASTTIIVLSVALITRTSPRIRSQEQEPFDVQ